MNKKTISFAIACFNEESNIFFTYDALKKIADRYSEYDFEYVYVDNGSKDKTRELILKLARTTKNIKGVFLSRNFGPESSGQAALDFATGDAVIPIECDLQDPPEVICKFIQKWEEGSKVVVGIRAKLEDAFFMSKARRLFYHLFKKI